MVSVSWEQFDPSPTKAGDGAILEEHMEEEWNT